jgi:sulfate permease, SulP family
MLSFRPKLFDTIKGYSRGDFSADLIAGFTVGIVALPLAMAFAIASGVDPKAGIYTAIIAGFLISALGGSKVQIGGPTGAFVAIVYGIVAHHGLDHLILCTLLAGVILVVMGLAGLGNLIKFIPFPVTAGFTSGIAVLILGTQIKDFFGIDVRNVPADFVQKLLMLARNFHPNWISASLAVATVLMIFLWPRKLSGRIPGSITALVLGTVAVSLFDLDTRHGVETIGTRFGGIPQGLPPFRFPDVAGLMQMKELFRDAFTIALLAAIESLLCAVVADGMIDDRHDSNQELLAQGAANIGSALLGGIPATGAIARTATNIRNGGRTPIAGIVHAVTLLVIILAAAPLAKNIPLATLSGVLVMVAIRMAEWSHFKHLRRWPRGDAAMFLVAFGLTVLIDLTVAVEVGMVLAAVLFIKRTSEATQITSHEQESDAEESRHSLAGREIPDGVVIFRIFGAFLFGAVDKLETAFKRTRQKPRVLILRMHGLLAIDATGLNALEEIYQKLHRHGGQLVISGLHAQPLFAMERSGFVDRIGLQNLCADLDHALQRARELLAAPSTHA